MCETCGRMSLRNRWWRADRASRAYLLLVLYIYYIRNGRGGYHTNLACTIMNEVVHQNIYASKRKKNVDGYLDGYYIIRGAYHGAF